MKRLLTTLSLLTSLSCMTVAQSQQSAPPQKVGPLHSLGIFTEENLPEDFLQVGNTDFFASRAWDYYDLALRLYNMYYSTAWNGYITCMKVDDVEDIERRPGAGK